MKVVLPHIEPQPTPNLVPRFSLLPAPKSERGERGEKKRDPVNEVDGEPFTLVYNDAIS